MRRKLSAAAIFLAALLLIAGCGEVPDDVSSAESVWPASSVVEESSEVSSEDVSSVPEETASDGSSEELSSEPSADTSPGEYSPFREEDEPDLGDLHLPAIPEEGFSFLHRSLTLRMGETAAVGYEFKPVGATDRKLLWSSSDETVVKVEDGRLTPVGLGKATVRAETSGGRSAECRVTVVAEDALSPLGVLAATLAAGNFDGLQFAKYDAELDGTAELFLRRIGTDGTPTVTVYNGNGEAVLTLSTGSDEEWAIWRRKTGGRYLLLSYTQATATGKRYVLEEITANNGKPARKAIFARETASDGTEIFYRFSGGGLTPCSEETYQQERKTYFSDNRQIPETVLIWVTGKTAADVDNALRGINLLG